MSCPCTALTTATLAPGSGAPGTEDDAQADNASKEAKEKDFIDMLHGSGPAFVPPATAPYTATP